MDEQIVDVLTKPLARVKFEYSGRSLVFSRSRFPPNGSDESMSHYNMVRGLVPSMVRCKCCSFLTWREDWFLSWLDISVVPFRHGERIGSFHYHMYVWIPHPA